MSYVKWRQFCLGLSVLNNWVSFFQNVILFSDIIPYDCAMFLYETAPVNQYLVNTVDTDGLLLWLRDINRCSSEYARTRLQPLMVWTSVGFREWKNNYIHVKIWDVITHPSRNINDNLTKVPLKLRYGCVITSQSFIWVQLLIHTIIYFCYKMITEISNSKWKAARV